jgi:hypothetical protein
MSMMPSTVYNLQTNQQVPTARIEAPDDPAAPDVKPPRAKLPTHAERKAALINQLRAEFGEDFARRLLGEDVPTPLLSDAVTCGEAVLEWARGHAAALAALVSYARGQAYAEALALDEHALDRPRACVATEARALIEAGECRAREYERAFEAWRLTGPFLCWQDAELLGEVLIEALAETEKLAEVETTETEPRKWFQRG